MNNSSKRNVLDTYVLPVLYIYKAKILKVNNSIRKRSHGILRWELRSATEWQFNWLNSRRRLFIQWNSVSKVELGRNIACITLYQKDFKLEIIYKTTNRGKPPERWRNGIAFKGKLQAFKIKWNWGGQHPVADKNRLKKNKKLECSILGQLLNKYEKHTWSERVSAVWIFNRSKGCHCIYNVYTQ